MAIATNDMPKRKRVRYSAEYRAEALALAERVGVAGAASELGLHATQIYQWRAKAAHEKSVSDRERQLHVENARLKRQLADKTEEVTILQQTTTYYPKKLDWSTPLSIRIELFSASHASAQRSWDGIANR
jgi:transposase